MNQYPIPQFFHQLQEKGCLEQKDIAATSDGFYLAYKSLSDILAAKGIRDFLDSEGIRLPCSSFFDDWFLYAVPEAGGYTYSLLKMREQEHDGNQAAPADGDVPGVTICFISFDYRILMDCLEDPSDANRQKLNGEINRVVARRGQHHHPSLKSYFVNPQSDGAYLVAAVYTKHIAALAANGCLAVPEYYSQILGEYSGNQNSSKLARLPRFMESLNREAGRMICDGEKIYIEDPAAPDRFERAAILAAHTGNTSVYSFAAEVDYHARFLIPIARFRIPLIGKSVYESAIRADMSVGDTEFQGPASFYREDSRIVKKQYICHKDRYQ